MSNNRWSCGRAIFQGNRAIKTGKMSSPFENNIAIRDIGPLTDIESIRYEDISMWHHIFGSVHMPSIWDLWPIKEVTKNIFLTNNTFHSIIMMIEVVSCKIDEEINYVSAFHNHVVGNWLRNQPAKLPRNRNKNTWLQMICLEHIHVSVVWYGQFVTNWCDFIKMPFYSAWFSSGHQLILGEKPRFR